MTGNPILNLQEYYFSKYVKLSRLWINLGNIALENKANIIPKPPPNYVNIPVFPLRIIGT